MTSGFHWSILPAVAGNDRDVPDHLAVASVLPAVAFIGVRLPANAVCLLAAAEDFLAWLDLVQIGVQLEQNVLLDLAAKQVILAACCVAVTTMSMVSPFGERSLKGDVGQFKGRFESKPSAPARTSESGIRPCSAHRACIVRVRAALGPLQRQAGARKQEVFERPLLRRVFLISAGTPMSSALNDTPVSCPCSSSGYRSRPTRILHIASCPSPCLGAPRRSRLGIGAESVIGSHKDCTSLGSSRSMLRTSCCTMAFTVLA